MPTRPVQLARIARRVALIVVLAAVLEAGVWGAGGVITNDFRESMALTAAWFALAGAGCLAVALRRPDLRRPVPATYVRVGGYLLLTTVRDRVVDETVVAGAPRATPATSRTGCRAARARAGAAARSGAARSARRSARRC